GPPQTRAIMAVVKVCGVVRQERGRAIRRNRVDSVAGTATLMHGRRIWSTCLPTCLPIGQGARAIPWLLDSDERRARSPEAAERGEQGEPHRDSTTPAPAYAANSQAVVA